MARRPASGRSREPQAPARLERVLRRTWITATFLAVFIGVFVLPIQFTEGHHARVAQEIERSGTDAHPVLEVRQKVDGARGRWSVEAQVATYRTEDGTATVRLRGYDQSAVVAREEGWLVAADRADRLEVYVAEDGRSGFLAADYRDALDGEFSGVLLAADLWIGGWAVVGLATLSVLSLRRWGRGVITRRRAALVPALYCAVAIASVALTYGLSSSLAAST
jgi:hypothetical protein